MKRLTPVVVLLAGACGTGESRQMVEISDSAGVPVTTSYDRPSSPPTDGWQLSPTPRIQVGNRINPNQQLYGARHALRFPDGRIVVANTGLSDVRIFDAGGSHVRTLTMPAVRGDTINPVQVHALPDDSILVVGRDHSLSVFGPEGRLARRAPVAEPAEGVPGTMSSVGMFENGQVLFRVDLPDDPEATGTGRRRIRLLRYGTDGRLIGPYGDRDFEDQALLFADRGGWIFGPSAQHAIADSTIWYGTAERFAVREIALDGRVLRVFRLDRPPIEVLSTDRSTYSSVVGRQMAGTGREAQMDTTLEASVFADTFPAYDRILVDDVGNVWVRDFQWFDLGSGRQWSVFDPTGRFLGSVRTPTRLQIFQIGPDFILARMVDNRGREAVYVYGLIKPGEEGGGGPEGGGGADGS